MKISDRALSEIRDKLDILDIIGEHVTLKNKGEEHSGLCPFHQEKTPSFSVNPSKGVFYCFGCGEKGDSIDFLIAYTRQSFGEIMTDLAHKYSIELGETEEDIKQWQEDNKVKKQLCEINETACQFFQSKLNDKALAYLSGRGIDSATINQFRLGYAADDWNDLLNLLLEKYEFGLVTKSGLVTQKGDSIYNSFRDRLMVPIFDPQGTVIGFSGRAFGDGKPKYLNSPETLLFKKSEILFPFHLAREAIVKANVALVVEGNFDVIRLHQIDIKNAIASLGTSLSTRQLNKLIRQTKDNNLILAFDNDEAGRKAVHRVIDENIKAIDQELVNVKVLQLPTGFKDVDEVISTPNGARVINQLIAEALPWVDWEIQNILKSHNLDDPIEFNLCSNDFEKLLLKISDRNLRNFYLARCGEYLARDNEGMSQDHTKALQMKIGRIHADDKKEKPIDIYFGLPPKDVTGLSCEMSLAKIALFNAELREQISNKLGAVNWFVGDPICRWILNKINEHGNDPYLMPKLKTELENTMTNQNIFEDTAEFLNCDYFSQSKIMIEKMKQLFSKSESARLSIDNPEDQINDIAIALGNIQIQNKINVAQIFLQSETEVSSQAMYLQQILQLKQQLV